MTAAPALVRTWSQEQEAIFGWFRTRAGADSHLVGRARAGTGKTTTILEALQYAPEGRILLAAFNKRIQEELSSRLQNPAAEAKTLHGAGFACVRRYWEGIKVSSGTSRQQALAQEVCGDQTPDAIKRLVGKLCTLAREVRPHAEQAGDLLELMAEHELCPDPEWEGTAFGADYVEMRALEAMALAAAKKPADGIDFADMLFLPLRNHWLVPIYDLGIVDEAQDMTVSQLELFRGIVKGRVVVVGDDRQAIYGFRGADSESLDRLKTELGAAELGLKTTYRCPRLIVEAAARLVPDYQAAPGAPDGQILSCPSIEALVQMAENKAEADFILSRTNAPLASVAMALIRRQKRVRIQGRDIGAGLIALVKKLSTGKAQTSIPAFFERLTAWQEREIARAERLDKPALVDAIRDKAETLIVVADGVTGPRELEARLQTLFSDEGQAGAIVCSSVHKAKGLEAKRVFILRPTLNPRPPKGKVKTPAQMREEENIQYVAITRAMDTLVWVEAK